jgi:hypothetical protein
MRGLSYILIVLGIIVGIVGLVNHYVIKQNPIAHTSLILIAVGAVLFVIGVLTFVMGGSKAAA